MFANLQNYTSSCERFEVAGEMRRHETTRKRKQHNGWRHWNAEGRNKNKKKYKNE